MNVGEYPCCGGELFLSIPERELPAFARHSCPHCGKKVWHKYSRVDPKTWTDEAFREEFTVDDVNGKITPRDGTVAKEEPRGPQE